MQKDFTIKKTEGKDVIVESKNHKPRVYSSFTEMINNECFYGEIGEAFHKSDALDITISVQIKNSKK